MRRRRVLGLLAAGSVGALGAWTLGHRPRAVPDAAKTPPDVRNADTVVYPPGSDDRIDLRADRQEATLPGATVEFTLSNRTWRPFAVDVYHYQLYRRAAGRWWYLGVHEPLQETETIGPGRSHTWQVTVNNELMATRSVYMTPSAASDAEVLGLGAGTYLFAAVAEFSDDDRVAVAVPFELNGEEVSVVPEPNLETTRSGGTVRVQRERRAKGETYELEVTRTDAEDATQLVSEWALRQAGVRNTVPFLSDGVRRVVFTATGPPVYAPEYVDGRAFSWRGQAVRFSVDAADG